MLPLLWLLPLVAAQATDSSTGSESGGVESIGGSIAGGESSSSGGADSSSADSSTAGASSTSSTASGTTGDPASTMAATPLTDKHFTYPDLPYQVDTEDGPRGIMQGYNVCNSTTENQDSLCTTAFFNNLTDFCIWSSPSPDGMIADIEGETVAWCTKAGHGTRIIPNGAIRGAQWITTPDYVQVAGVIDQAAIDLMSNDTGGEMDPFGADKRGNPLGGLVFSTAFADGNSTSTNSDGIQQVMYWHNFMGNNQFCFKACNPGSDRGLDYCQHIYDIIIADYKNLEGRFETCESDNALPPGVYVGSDGQTSTYSQPGESVVDFTVPYSPEIPSSSNCRTFESSDIFSDGITVSADPAESTMPLSTTIGVSNIPGATESSSSGSGSSGNSAADETDAAFSMIQGNSMVALVLPAALAMASFVAVLA